MIVSFDEQELGFLYAHLSRTIASEWPLRNCYAESCWKKLRKEMPKFRVEYCDTLFDKEALDVLLEKVIKNEK